MISPSFSPIAFTDVQLRYAAGHFEGHVYFSQLEISRDEDTSCQARDVRSTSNIRRRPPPEPPE